MPKPITVRIKVEESQAFEVMRRLRKLPGVVGLEFDFDAVISGGAGGVRNGAGRPKGAPSGSKRLALLNAIADGKPHSNDDIRQRTGFTIKEMHNTRWNAVRDRAAKGAGKGMVQITARGVEQLKASK